MPASHKTPPLILNALNMAALAPVAGFGTAAFQIQGTYSGEITFEASVQGSEFQPFRVTKSDNSTAVTTTTTTGIYSGSVAGYEAVRARMTTYSNGAAQVIILAAPPSGGGAGGGGGSGTDVNLIEVGGSSIALGETTMANSLPVVIASDQDPIPITGSISVSNPSVGPTGDPVPAEANYIGVQDASGDLTGLAAVAFDYNSTSPPVVLTHAFGLALPGAGGPVAGGTTTNPIRVAGTGTAGTAAAAVTTVQGIASMTPVQVSQATGTNLHTVIDSGTLTTVSTVTAVTAITNALPAGNNNIGDMDVASVIPGVGATNLGKAEDAGHNSGDTGVFVLAVENEAQVAFGNSADYYPFSVDSRGNAMVVGNVANDAADARAPVKIGYVAYSPDGTTPGTAVAELDRVNSKGDLNGRLFVNPHSPQSLTAHLNGSSAYSDEALIADPGDGFQVVITNIIASTGAATALNFHLEAPASTIVFGPIYLEAVNGRGFCSGPMYLPIAASTAVTLTSSASIPQSFQVGYFIQAV